MSYSLPALFNGITSQEFEPVVVSEVQSPTQETLQVVDLRPIEDAELGSAFNATDAQSGEHIEIRLMPWAQEAEVRRTIERQIRLVSLLVPNGARQVIVAQLHLSPPRINLRCSGHKLNSLADRFAPNDRLEVAAAIWKVASLGLSGGLFQGSWSRDHIRVIDGPKCSVQVDYLARFYCKSTCEDEPTVELESAAIVNLVYDLLKPIVATSTELDGISGQQRAQLRSLLRQKLELGRELEQFERWSQFFGAFNSSTPQDSPSRQLNLDRPLDDVALPSDDSTCEVVVEVPASIKALNEDKTGEVEITPAINVEIVPHTLEPGCRIGRFRLDKLLGQGGMGVVYRGIDLASDEIVAIKLLRPCGGDVAQAVRRFKKEARLLASIQNDYVTRLFDAGYENGFHYLAMEFVPGTNLKDWLKNNPVVSETSALQLIADVARALVDAHQQEIVHRDIKPENILLKSFAHNGECTSTQSLGDFQVKLSDFGIARTVQQSISMEVTRAGTLLGTPTYMSPEQCKGTGVVSPASDIYALGVMLYALLAGKPPFESDDPMQLAAMHCFEPPANIKRRNHHVTDTTSDLLARMLAKNPTQRPGDAAQLIREIEHILRGESGGFELHPQMPSVKSAPIWERVFEWDLRSEPSELWPYVSNTERLNRAAGLQAVQYRTEKSESGELRKFGTFRLAGLRIEWEEHPFEWIEGKRMGVLREFAKGPFCWFMSLVELTRRPEGGTHLRHIVRVAPRGKLGRIVATIEAGWKGGRQLDRIYRRIDEFLQSQRHNAMFDPYEPPEKNSSVTLRRANQRVNRVKQMGVRPELAEELKDYVLNSPPQVLAQIRPIDLSEHLSAPVEETIDACLVAAHCGMLQLRWDILCPTCRAPASTSSLLSEIGKHTECEACDTEFQSNLASAIELVFQCSPEIRSFDDGHYCIGGPEHSPHVVTQLRLASNERIELSIPVGAGDYLLRATRNPKTQQLRARSQAAPSNLDLRLSQFGTSSHTPVVRSGTLTLSLTNDLSSSQIVRLERTVDRTNVVTAATASALPRFRELFPEQVFNRDQAIAAEELTLLAARIVDIDSLYANHGDAEAYQILQQCFELFERCLVANQGAVIKSVGETVLGSFHDSVQAVGAAVSLSEYLNERSDLSNVNVAVAIHRGPLLVTTQNGRLDYFGTTARHVQTLCAATTTGVALTDNVFSDVAVQLKLKQLPNNQHSCQNHSVTFPGGSQRLVQLILLNDR